MKKRIFSMIAAVCILLTTAGCQKGGSENSAVTSPSVSTSEESTESPIQSETTSTNSEYSSEPSEFFEEAENTVQQIKVSDMFTAPGRRIWYYVYHEFSTGTPISYNDPVYAVYVVKDGKITAYDGAQRYLDDFDQMTDDEAIAYAEAEFPNKEEACEISFSYVPDATGNNLKTEIIDIFYYSESEFFPGRKYPHSIFKDGIRGFFEPTTILSKEYFGIELENDSKHVLATKYDPESPIEIILNEAGDEGIERE